MWQSLLELIPSGVQILSGTVAALLALSVARGVAVGAHFGGWRVGDTRKLFHLLIFAGAALLRIWQPIASLMVYGSWIAVVIFVCVGRGERSALYRSIARPADGDQRSRNVILSLVATAFGGVISHLLVGRLAVVGFLVTGLGDAVGEPIGVRWGKHPLPLRSKLFGRRTWEGSAAVLVATLVAALSGGMLCQLGLNSALPMALVVAVSATITEAVSPAGTDNFTMQIATSVVLAIGWM